MYRSRLFASGLVSALAMLAVAQHAQAATIYNAVNDFSSTNGGSSVWSYGYNVSNAYGTPTLLDQYLPGIFQGQVNAWHNSDGSCCGGNTNDNSVLIGKNTTGGPISYETIVQPNNYLSEDPEKNASADLIFTAKKAGLYSFSFSFSGIDTQAGFNNASHQVDLLRDHSLFGSIGVVSGYGTGYSGSGDVYLRIGDTLDFQTQTSPNTFAYLSTGVQANIALSAVPLPASAPMFGAALLALGAVGYGLKRKAKAV